MFDLLVLLLLFLVVPCCCCSYSCFCCSLNILVKSRVFRQNLLKHLWTPRASKLPSSSVSVSRTAPVIACSCTCTWSCVIRTQLKHLPAPSFSSKTSSRFLPKPSYKRYSTTHPKELNHGTRLWRQQKQLDIPRPSRGTLSGQNLGCEANYSHMLDLSKSPSLQE